MSVDDGTASASASAMDRPPARAGGALPAQAGGALPAQTCDAFPSAPEDHPPPATFWQRVKERGRLDLSADTTAVHFSFYLLASLLTIAFFVFMNSGQAFVLTILLGVPTSQLGTTSGTLLLVDQILSILLMGTWGGLSDVVGRRVVFVFGFAIMGVAFILFPHMPSVYPGLLLARLLFAVGAAASSTMITAVLADYVGDKSRGKISGLVGITSGLGAMFGAFVLVRLPSLLTASESTNAELAAAIRLAYLIVGLSSMCVAVLLAVTLKPRHADFFTCDFWRTHYAMARRAVTNRWHGTADKRDSAEVANRNVADEKGVTATATGMPPGHSGVGVASEDSVVARCPYLAHQQQPKQQSSPSNSGEFASLRKTSTASSIPGEETAFLGQPKSGSASTNDNAAQLGCTMPGVLEQTEAAKREGMWSLIWKGFQLGWRSPYIMLAYLGGFVARGDSIIITLFLPLWINAYYAENGLCGTHTDDPTTDSPTHRCAEAFTQASIYGGIAQTCALFGAPLFGIFADRFKNRRSVPFLVASVVSFAGYFSIFFLTDPVNQSALMYPLLCLIGLGEIGMIVTSLCLVTSNRLVRAEIRGSVAGCYSLMGGLGILVSTEIGGILFDSWRETAPFLLMSLLGSVTMIGAAAVVTWESMRARDERRTGQGDQRAATP